MTTRAGKPYLWECIRMFPSKGAAQLPGVRTGTWDLGFLQPMVILGGWMNSGWGWDRAEERGDTSQQVPKLDWLSTFLRRAVWYATGSESTAYDKTHNINVIQSLAKRRMERIPEWMQTAPHIRPALPVIRLPFPLEGGSRNERHFSSPLKVYACDLWVRKISKCIAECSIQQRVLHGCWPEIPRPIRWKQRAAWWKVKDAFCRFN